ncbi:hypothetical protein G6F70_004671 [Rhizopus microsporus]|nr:hypothetical protein G6F71_004058 [Rhizopus microsporus]KAG1199710.1 hypothetical protein G6F70_004671 [Rhizopus microsporus]KAG1211442.1 hypothetical protein G6F69_004580 [Rhizopus microsporus]KAG1233364.1 hypothetical protein G6F67_004318 [Rhizopus microsporus]KAG1266254.1 hypothetical protein G6F68_002919 [Rhizopus microsporus]
MKVHSAKILTQKDLEKEFIAISKLFVGKETEHNWEKRDAAIRQLRETLHSTHFEEWKSTFVRGIHDVASDVIKTIHSLRSSVALEGLALISDISLLIGECLDLYTIETILTNLLKCCSTTKKIIVSKSNEVTSQFLSRTNYHFKVVSILCKNISDKNTQVRQSSALFLKTVLQTHGQKEQTKLAIGKAESTALIHQSLNKGLSDASPSVREACRQAYWTYHEYWPNEAKKLCITIDTVALRQLEKSNKGKKISPIPLFNRSNSSSSISTTSSSSSKPPTLKRASSNSEVDGKKHHSIPAVSIEVKKNLSIQKLTRLSHISHVSAPTAPVAYKLNRQLSTTHARSQRQTKSDFHHRSALESASILNMLKSNDTNQRCNGIRKLSEKLHNTVYNPSGSISLPPDVPSKLNLLPILMDYISRKDLELEVYQTLMSWESLAGIFVYVMSLNYYAPTLIIADQQCKSSQSKRSDMTAVFSKGLARMKLFLKRNDPGLVMKLLNLLKSTENVQKSKQLDSSVKRDILLFPINKEHLQVGLLEWIDQLACDYLGLAQDEDMETLMEGSRWLNASLQTTTAERWFDVDENVKQLTDYVVHMTTADSTKHQELLQPALQKLIEHLKMINATVFDDVVQSANKDPKVAENSLLQNVLRSIMEEQSTDSVALEDLPDEMMIQDMDFSVMDKLNELDEYNASTGMTQELSNIRINPQVHYINNTSHQNNTSLQIQDIEAVEKKSSTSAMPIVHPPDSPKPSVVLQQEKIETPVDSPEIMPQKIETRTTRVKNSRPASSPSVSVDDRHYVKKQKHVHEQSTETTSAEADQNPTREKLSIDASIKLDMLQSGIARIRSNQVDEALLLRLQRLSNDTPIQDIYNIEDGCKFWLNDYAEPFRSLLSGVTKYLADEETQDPILRIEAVQLIKKMIICQRALFLRFAKVITKGHAHQIYYVLKTLLKETTDIYSNISVVAEDAISQLLSIYSPEVSLKLLQDVANHFTEATHIPNTQTNHQPLGVLFSYVSKVAPDASNITLDQFLKKGVADLLSN